MKQELIIEISLAKPEDARSIRELQYKLALTTYPNEEVGLTTDDFEDLWKDRFTDEKIRKYIEEDLEKPNKTTLVAKEGGKVIGFCSVEIENSNKLSALYVLPEYQSMGIGKQLWKKDFTIL